MPFLRSLVTHENLELQSSKTLIGSGATTCDVVISGDNVLELHALLNLSADKTSAKLIPFSTTEAGVCYMNDVVVPRDGVTVVHGDRVAFGNLRNVFLFELTAHSPMATALQQSIETANSTQRSRDQMATSTTAQTFRKALEALRRDRKLSIPSASASMQSNLAATSIPTHNTSLSSVPSTVKSKEQLKTFLVEASCDSLLSDYVERKLKQRCSRATSTADTNLSEKPRNRKLDSVRRSKEEHNLAQTAKVLNQDMELEENYLSPTAKSSRSSKPHRAGSNFSRRGDSGAVQDTNVDGSDDEDEEYDEDELPDMKERAGSVPRVSRRGDSSIQIRSAEQKSTAHPPIHEEAEEEDELLDFSLECSPTDSFKARDFFPKAQSLGLNDLTRSHSRPTKEEQEEAAMTALHRKFIAQTIRQKRNRIRNEAFARWRKGLHIQRKNRERKAHQLEDVNAALVRLRHARQFLCWRDYAAMSSQVLICRLEAFQQRHERRLTRTCWTALHLHSLLAKHQSTHLRRLVTKKVSKTRQTAFRRWELFARKCSANSLLSEGQRTERRKLHVYLQRISERHYYHRRIKPLLTQILQRWATAVEQRKKKRQVLRKLLVRGFQRLVQRAWRKWVAFALIVQHHVEMKKEIEQRIHQTTERLTSQHDQAQSSIRKDYAHKLQKLVVTIEERDREIEQTKQQRRAQALSQTAAKKKKEQDLHRFFENAIVTCDEEIAQAGDQLEELLQSAEDDILAARFGAAQFLVNCMLLQKVRNANEYIRLQESHHTMLSSNAGNTSMPASSRNFTFDLSSNSRFLYDMIQQRLVRLQQLHQSLARLAAVSDGSCDSLDPERFRHSSFIAHALFQRQQTHLVAFIMQFSRLGRSTR